jgi:hypothetical protein
MSATVAELGERALRRLGVAIVPVADRPMLTSMVVPVDVVATNALIALAVIALDETPSNADQALALAKVLQVQASLASQAVVWWTDAEGVPMAVAEEYTRLVATQLASAFGKPADMQSYGMFEDRVRRMALVLGAPDYAEGAVQATHDDLVARGRARWSVWDIPEMCEEPYVWLAANRLAPLFDKQPSPRDDIAADVALARYIALPTSGEPVQGNYF